MTYPAARRRLARLVLHGASALSFGIHPRLSLLRGILPVLLGAVLASCDPFGDLQQALPLVDPIKTRFNTPGRQLLAGEFVEMVAPNATDRGIFVSARAKRGDKSYLKIASLDPGDSGVDSSAELRQCETPEFDTLLKTGFFVGTLPVFNSPDADGYGTLVTYDDRCAEHFRASEVRVTLSTYWFSSYYVLEHRTGELSIFDGITERPIVSNESAEVLSTSNLDLWVKEANSLALYAVDSGKELFRISTQALGAWPALGVNANAILYQDALGFHYFWDGEIFDLGATLCEPLLGSQRVYSLDPCEDGHLRIDFFTRDSGSVEHQTSHSNVPLEGAPLEVRSTAGDAFLIRTKSPAVPGRVYVVREKSPSLSLAAQPGEGRLLGSNVHFLANFDGTSGTLFEVGATSVTKLAERATDVKSASDCAVLANTNYEEGLTDLVCFESKSTGENTVELVASGVPEPHLVSAERARRLPSNAYATRSDNFVVQNAKGFFGQLVRFGPKSVVDEDVSALEYAEMSEPAGVAYLKANGSTTDLTTYLDYAGLAQTIHENVGTFLVTTGPDSPNPGIFYLVKSGKDAGLWFSKAQ